MSDNPHGIGWLSREFVNFYFRDPPEVLGRLDDACIAGQGYRADMHPVRFLRQDRLGDDLHDALVDLGYAPHDLAFIRRLGRVLPGGKGRAPDRGWEHYYTPELKCKIRRNERLLFSLFPEFDASSS
jgi:hypothetical protein